VINQLLVQVSALYAKVPFDPLADFIPADRHLLVAAVAGRQHHQDATPPR
jgi:hypothetical protein